MPKIGAKEIAAYARGAGFAGDALTTAVAVALAESGGDTDAVGDQALVTATWGPSVGLWQIRSVNAEIGTGNSRDAARLGDPGFNARSAYKISNGGKNWTPWTAFNTGAFLLKLGQARKGVQENGARVLAPTGAATTLSAYQDGAGGPGLIDSTASGLAALVGFPTKVLAWVSDRNNIVRVSKVVLGGGLVLVGLYAVTRPVQKGVQDVAGKVVGLVGPVKGAKAPKAAAPKAPAAA